MLLPQLENTGQFHMQIGSLIRRAALHFKSAPCLVQDDRALSFAEFDAATNRLGNALLAHGLEPGDRVGVLLPNSSPSNDQL